MLKFKYFIRIILHTISHILTVLHTKVLYRAVHINCSIVRDHITDFIITNSASIQH